MLIYLNPTTLLTGLKTRCDCKLKASNFCIPSQNYEDNELGRETQQET